MSHSRCGIHGSRCLPWFSLDTKIARVITFVDLIRNGLNKMTYKSLAQVLTMLSELEDDLGLRGLLPLERDILAVIGSKYEAGETVVRTEQIMTHPLLKGVARSSLHRALRALMERNLIAYATGYKSGRYVIRNSRCSPP